MILSPPLVQTHETKRPPFLTRERAVKLRKPIPSGAEAANSSPLHFDLECSLRATGSDHIYSLS